MRHYRIVPLFQGAIVSGYQIDIDEAPTGMIFATREEAQAEVQRLERIDDLMQPRADNDR